MKFDTVAAVEACIWTMRYADYPRSKNRARVNDLFNGCPPYSDAEQRDNHISTNVNDLSATKIDHDARRQYDNAFITPDPLFNIVCDYGPIHKRQEWSMEITSSLNKIISESPEYLELRQSTFGSVVLHGIGPVLWENRNDWCPIEYGIEDILVPSKTLRSLRNLPLFAVFKQYTFEQLLRYTSGPVVDPGWNMPLVEKLKEWVDKQTATLMNAGWPEIWSPEKMSERIKGDSGFYANDQVPTVDCFDFYYYCDEGEESGWRRRIILDTWGQPGLQGYSNISDRKKDLEFARDQFLYDGKDRVYRGKLDQLVHFQFGDASAVAPFRYHSVRSLGFLLYAVCHLQNRLKCKFTDSVFESLLQYFRINNPNDVDRLQKIDLVHLGILPEGLDFVKPEERWKVDQPLVSEAMAINRQTMADMSASFSQTGESQDANESATLTMQRASTSASLIGSMLTNAYACQRFQYIEICRRFCIDKNPDPGVKKFRLEVLRKGIPQEALNSERWNVQVNKVIGGGNKQLAIAMSNELYAMRPNLSPSAQRIVDRIKIAVTTDNYALAKELVQEQPSVSNTIHDTELAYGALMMGSEVTPKDGLNPAEVAETILRLMAQTVTAINQSGGVGTQEQIQGLQNAANYATAFIEMLAQDPASKQLVKMLGDELGNLTNMVKAFAERLQEQQQAQAQQGGGLDPATASKVQANQILAQQKAENSKQSHAQKTAQKQISFEQQMSQKEKQFQIDTEAQIQQMKIDFQKQLGELRLELDKKKVQQVQPETVEVGK
jgi:hypothetical protein